MNQPVINILIRVSRDQLFARCYESVKKQTYKNIRIILGYDNKDLFNKHFFEYKFYKIVVLEKAKEEFGYNAYLNVMKSMVATGWWMVLDDDDKLAADDVIERIAEQLVDEDQPIICQFLRRGVKKPADMYMDKRSVTKGRIGMPCLILNSKHNDIARFEATEDADYRFIKAVHDQLKCKFVKIAVVDAGERNYGDKESGIDVQSKLSDHKAK